MRWGDRPVAPLLKGLNSMDAQKINVKYYLKDGGNIGPEDWFKTFNTWIPDPGDDVLIDVHDYSHMQAGPVILLVGHYGNYGIDNTHGRLGLLYGRKQPLEGSFSERLRAAFLTTFQTCRRLEEDPNLKGRVTFQGDEAQLVLNDRLLAPNTEETLAAVAPDLKGLLEALYPGADVDFKHNPDPKQRVTLDIKADGTWDMATLLKNIQA